MIKLTIGLLLTLLILYLSIEKKTHFIIVSSIFIIISLVLYRDNTNKEHFGDSGYLNYSMGPYSNLILKPKGCSKWRHPPANLPLNNDINNNVYQGNQLPLKKNKYIDLNNPDGPNVDGTKNSPKSLFMFSFNKCSPECCPSTYSCDKGCVCTNEKQRHFINTRGTPKINEYTEI